MHIPLSLNKGLLHKDLHTWFLCGTFKKLSEDTSNGQFNGDTHVTVINYKTKAMINITISLDILLELFSWQTSPHSFRKDEIKQTANC